MGSEMCIRDRANNMGRKTLFLCNVSWFQFVRDAERSCRVLHHNRRVTRATGVTDCRTSLPATSQLPVQHGIDLDSSGARRPPKCRPRRRVGCSAAISVTSIFYRRATTCRSAERSASDALRVGMTALLSVDRGGGRHWTAAGRSCRSKNGASRPLTALSR